MSDLAALAVPCPVMWVCSALKIGDVPKMSESDKLTDGCQKSGTCFQIEKVQAFSHAAQKMDNRGEGKQIQIYKSTYFQSILKTCNLVWRQWICTAMWWTLCSITVVHHDCLKVENYVKLLRSLVCFGLLLSLPEVIMSAKIPNATHYCHLVEK